MSTACLKAASLETLGDDEFSSTALSGTDRDIMFEAIDSSAMVRSTANPAPERIASKPPTQAIAAVAMRLRGNSLQKPAGFLSPDTACSSLRNPAGESGLSDGFFLSILWIRSHSETGTSGLSMASAAGSALTCLTAISRGEVPWKGGWPASMK